VNPIARVRAWFAARRPLWSVFPTRRLAVVVLATSPLWLVPGDMARVAALVALGAIAIALVADFVRLPRRGAVVGERTMPDSVGLGDRTELAYTIRSMWPWPVRAELFHELPPALAAEALPGALRLDAPGEFVERVAAVARTRGRHPLGVIALRLRTPIGLLVRIARVAPGDAVAVVPSLAGVRRFRLLSIQHRLSDAGVRALKQRGEGRSFAGLREYVPGDDPRLLDWKATARHGHLITREHTVERSQTVVALIDCGRAMTQLAGAYSRFEHVLSAATVLTDVALTGGDRVGLLAFDDVIRAYVPAQRGAASLKHVRSALGALDATLTEPDYASAFRLLALRQRKRALVVFFTDVIDARVARSLVALVSRSAQHHAVVVVAIQNDELLAAARPTAAVGGSVALGLYRSAAAEELVRERENALARMRRAGVGVLDVAPTQMTAAVVNRYLEIKARGVL
jgi:uncharacterized protein (DUF58 family)